jgi:anti-sigma regulatory factor (Ser/Thr protein kinase)
LRVLLDPRSRIRVILEELSLMELEGIEAEKDRIIYALIELITNSMRAQRERLRFSPISLEISARDGSYHFRIRDSGGGFDPRALPYDIDLPPSSVSVDDPKFHAYREAHAFSRFGMGIHIARLTFDDFDLSFIDKDGTRLPWYSGRVWGTSIAATKRVKGGPR